MRLTNKKGLPEPIFLAIKKIADSYDNGGSYLSCSAVLKPAKIFHLERRHSDEIEVDAIYNIMSYLGTLHHNAAEEAAIGLDNVLAEERHHIMFGDDKFSGQYDLFYMDEGHLKDYKLTTAFQVMKNKEEWVSQLSCLKFLMHKDGVKVKRGSIEATVRDWSPAKAKRDRSYPEKGHITIPIKLWNLKDTEKFIKERITFYKSFEDVADDDIPVCSLEDRWSDKDKYATMMKGKKRAVKLHDKKEDAQTHAIEIDGFVEPRVAFGKDRRCCPNYCDCRLFCNYYKEHYMSREDVITTASNKVVLMDF